MQEYIYYWNISSKDGLFITFMKATRILNLILLVSEMQCKSRRITKTNFSKVQKAHWQHVPYAPVAVLRIRIHRIRMFLGLTDAEPLVRGTDTDPDPSIIKQKMQEKPWFFIFENDVNAPSKKVIPVIKKLWRKNNFFVAVLNFTDENRRIRIR
jgi:hypothetical protein